MANNGTLSLRFLRQLAAPATGFDSFGKDPVYLHVGGRFYELADFSFVSGPSESRVEIQAGREVTEREIRAKDRKVIDDYLPLLARDGYVTFTEAAGYRMTPADEKAWLTLAMEAELTLFPGTCEACGNLENLCICEPQEEDHA